jgi:hypothetical protein
MCILFPILDLDILGRTIANSESTVDCAFCGFAINTARGFSDALGSLLRFRIAWQILQCACSPYFDFLDFQNSVSSFGIWQVGQILVEAQVIFLSKNSKHRLKN